MIPRTFQQELLRRLDSSPAVGIVGPRQCGKTTLARSLSASYFDLEQPTDQLRIDLEWEEVAASNQLVILDEAQEWPAIPYKHWETAYQSAENLLARQRVAARAARCAGSQRFGKPTLGRSKLGRVCD
ncbi:MAG: AAA family ATPase [Armatimonadetes bacterium]|nr:AAA family ATPase [Armatimonadota bacterium]